MSTSKKFPTVSRIAIATLFFMGFASAASASGFQVEFTAESKLSDAAKTTLIKTLQTHCTSLTKLGWRFQELNSDAVRFKIDQGVYDTVYHSTVLASDTSSKQNTVIEMRSMYYEVNNAPGQDELDVLEFTDSAKFCRQER